MITLSNPARSLGCDQRGTAAIETAILAPVLLMLSLGAIEVSTAVARQNELQNAADVAAGVVLAAKPDTPQKLSALKSVVVASTGLDDSKVAVSLIYRCGLDADYVALVDLCGSEYHTTYVRLALEDRYMPSWTRFGLGGPVTLRVVRQAIAEQSS
ncbi:TadE/TadG family type IV pilus assembly protein [Croceicoccus mobilis]|uniref:TadE-like domain-containing protein n=1 Tax=Croceicoccus mobilis TaxID=1703339 RepID=A0A916ZB33_9SPHN|nr:TadE/TadG family type IV pilus assembly protein [Croceicoccus mobilis]GGD85066.1 hypothetical protein GCM10010990_38840 [Croceicoccus mobilis]